MTMTDASSKYFDQVAGKWDNIRAGYFTEAVRRAAIDRAYLRPEMAAADVGSGTGFVAAGLAPLVRQVHVLDGSSAMLDEARRNLAQFTNVVYHLADGQALSLPDASVDVVFANMYLHHCKDPQAALCEMARILKPGGRMVITDMDAHTHTWMKEAMADEWLGFERSQVRSWMRAADLVDVLVTCSGESCTASTNDSLASDETAASFDGSAGESAETAASVSIFLAVGTRRVRMREQVETTYSERVTQGGSCCSPAPEQKIAVQASSCCSPSAPLEEMSFVPDYSLQERSLIPAEAQEISFGCGNPLAFSNIVPGEVVLDIGSGGGVDVFLAARKVGETGKAIGVDMTPAMLARARAAAARAGIANVEFRQGQAEALPAADNSVDLVISNCVINLVEDKSQAFAEIFRVLKPGGRIEVSDVVTSTAFSPAMRQQGLAWAECISGAIPEREYLDLLAQEGFTDIVVRRSARNGISGGVEVYSAIVAAVKPA